MEVKFEAQISFFYLWTGLLGEDDLFFEISR